MVLQLSGGPRATVAIGGPSGILSSSPAPVAARAAVAAPTPTRTITFQTSTTPIKITAVPSPTQTIQSALGASAAKTTITPSAGLQPIAPKVVSSPVPTSALAPPATTKLIVETISSPRQTITPTVNLHPVEIQAQPPTSIKLTPDVYTPLPVLAPAPVPTSLGNVINAPVPQNSLLNTPAVVVPTLSPDINKTVQSIVAAANKAASSVAQKTDTNWEASLKTADKLDITEKIQTALAKSLASKQPVANFSQFVMPQLSALSAVSKASLSTITSKATTLKTQNNAEISNAIANIQKLASSGMKLATTPAAARDVKSASDLGINTLLNIKEAANKTIDQDHAILVDAVGNMVKNNIKNAVTGQKVAAQPVTKLIEFKTTPAKGSNIYTVLKDMGYSDAQITSGKAPTSEAVQKLRIMTATPGLVTESKARDIQGEVDAFNKANSGSTTYATQKPTLPGSGNTDDQSRPIVGQSKIKEDASIKPKADSKPVATKNTGSDNKPKETQAQKNARTIAEAKASGALDTGGSIGGSISGMIRPAEANMGVWTGKYIPGSVSIKTSTGNTVRVDPNVYSALKETGWSDIQMANSMASGKVGVVEQKYTAGPNKGLSTGRITLDDQAYSPNAVISSSLFIVDPIQVSSGGKTINAPEWGVKKAEAAGLSKSDIVNLSPTVLNKIATASFGKPLAAEGTAGSLITEAKTALLPYEQRLVDAGLSKFVPLTEAQKTALESQDQGVIGTTLAKLGNLFGKINHPEYPNGYVVQDTVEGLIAKSNLLNDLATPGKSLKDVPTVGGVTSYEMFSDALKIADKSTLDKIAKSNPRVLLGAATDPSLRPVLETVMGSTFEPAIKSSMNTSELEQYNRDAASKNPDLRFNINTFKGMEEYGQAHSIDAASILYDAVTTYPGANLLLTGLIPIGRIGSAGKVIKSGLELSRDGDIVRDGIIVGKAIAHADDASIIRAELKDGSVIDISRDSSVVKFTEVKSASIISEVKTAVSEQQPTKLIEFKTVPKSEAKGFTVGELKSTTSKAAYEPTPLAEINARIASRTPEVVESITYKPITSADIKITEDLGQGVVRADDGQKYVKYGKDRYLAVSEDYNPNTKGILSVQQIDDLGKSSITRLTTGANEADNVFHISYADDAGTVRTIAARPGTSVLTEEDAMKVVQADYDARLAAADAVNLPKTTEEEVAELNDLLAQQEAGFGDEAPGGGGSDYGGSGGDGGAANTPVSTNPNEWTYNADWGTEIKLSDDGKTWMVKDPETGTAVTTTEYEKLLTDRNEARRSKYDATTNTYKKLEKDGTAKYQDSAGGWVTKSELDAERAAIATNNPTFTYGVDSNLDNARIRTNDATKAVQYMDPQTGNWVDKSTYTTLVGSPETPIWNSEGYYYFRKSDGTFEILNPYTNTRQSPEAYGEYLASRQAAATPAPTQVSTYQAPQDYSSYVPNLQSTYDTSIAQVAGRETGVEGTLSAWDQFVNTADFDKVIKSEADTQILVKAKNGESLTESEISRAQYLRSQMSKEGKAALDAATGGQTQTNLMPAADFENLMTANRESVASMSDAEIKAAGLPPEKEIVVHQVKADENISKFLATDEYVAATPDAQKIIQAEIGYFAGEPSTISNLLNKFNSLKSTWTIKSTEYWNKAVEALRSAKNLISEMPVWWKDENTDFSMAELVLGNSKFSDILVSSPRSPAASTMEKAFQKAIENGMYTAGTDGAIAFEHTFKKLPGWIVKSPEGTFSFIRKSDLITTTDEAIEFAIKPVDMYFWEKPTAVQKQFQIPADADGSKIISISKADPFAASTEEWAGLTKSGGLTSDMKTEFVKIDLMTPTGQLWSTVREATKSGSFQIGKTVNVVEQDAIRVAGMAGTDIQALTADEFRAFVETNANEIRNIPSEDFPYLTKYLDDTRVEMVEAARVAPVEVIQAPNEVVQIENVQHEVVSAEDIIPSTGTSGVEAASKYNEAAAKLEATRANVLNSADDVSRLSDDFAEASKRAAADPKNKELAAEKVASKSRLTAAESKLKAYNRAQYDDLAIAKAQAASVQKGTGSINDLLNELDTLPVADGKKTFENVISKDEALKNTIQNMSRSEAEDLAGKVSEKLGSDRSQAEKIMGLNYQGAANRIPDSAVSKMTRGDQELISKAKTRQLNQADYQQIERILDNAKAYDGVSISSDLGRIKINGILDSSVADKTSELRKLLSDTDVKTALKDERFADEAFNKVYDINPDVATQYQKAAQDAIISAIKANPKYNSLSRGAKDFVDQLYTKKTYNVEDMERLAEIQATLPRGMFNRFVRGTVIGSAGKIAKYVSTHKIKTIGGIVGTYLIINGAFFIYFAAEEGTQSLIQMVGFNSPVDQFANQMNETGLPAMNKINEMLAPFDWAIENIPGFSALFPAAVGFKWYMDYAAISQIKDKLGKITNAGLWVPDTGCKQGPGCWGNIRPESEWPAYFAANPDKVQYWDADFTGRVYDIQPDGSIGPNNMIAQGLGITDPKLAVQVGLGHMQAAANQGAKKILTDDFSAAYAQVVKGGATSEMALKAYTDAVSAKGGSLPTTKSAGTTVSGLTTDQAATISVAPTTMDALTKYATFGGTQPGDAQVWRSAFIKPDGSLDMAKLKTAYPDMTAAQMNSLFPKEAINKMIAADMAGTSDPVELAKKLNEYKATGMIDSSARIEQFMPATQAAAFTARQNNPTNFKMTASGNTISWVDDTGYPHTSNIIQSGKLLNPETGQYDINQKKSDEGGAEYTLDTGKYAEFINSGGKDVAAFLSKEENWACTYNCSAKSGSSSKGSGGGGSSKGSSSKSTGQTGIFIDTAGQGAEVYENSEKIGDTDVIIEVEAGIHTVTIQKSGYKSYTIPVQVYAGSIARKSVTLYASTTTTTPTQTKAEIFMNAIGGENALTPDHIVYAYALSKGDSDLAAIAKGWATPAITGNWTFTSTDVISLITAYGGV